MQPRKNFEGRRSMTLPLDTCLITHDIIVYCERVRQTLERLVFTYLHIIMVLQRRHSGHIGSHAIHGNAYRFAFYFLYIRSF